jgi:hypothetical protein
MAIVSRLRLIYLLILLAITAVIAWASHRVALWHIPQDIVLHPWFIATLFDTYFAFFTFWLWVAYKEHSAFSRVVWLLLIFALGNIAIATYLLLQLRRLPPDAGLDALLLRSIGIPGERRASGAP